MATNKVTEDKKVVTTNRDDLDAKTPESAKTNGEKDGTTVREPQVGTPLSTSFDERTGVTLPFVLADGTQDNGLRDPGLAEGARATTTRDNDDSTTVEETDKAIKAGKVEGPQLTVDDAANDKPQNPVK